MGLEEFRKEINEIDHQILELLNQRAEVALKIGKEKQQQNLPIYVPEREKQIYKTLLQANPGPLSAQVIESIFKNIIEACREMQNR